MWKSLTYLNRFYSIPIFTRQRFLLVLVKIQIKFTFN